MCRLEKKNVKIFFTSKNGNDLSPTTPTSQLCMWRNYLYRFFSKLFSLSFLLSSLQNLCIFAQKPMQAQLSQTCSMCFPVNSPHTFFHLDKYFDFYFPIQQSTFFAAITYNDYLFYYNTILDTTNTNTQHLILCHILFSPFMRENVIIFQFFPVSHMNKGLFADKSFYLSLSFIFSAHFSFRR